MNKPGINWREWVEILAAVGIVAALLLVAWELRQANRIAEANVAAELLESQAGLARLRLTDPSLAALFAKIESPEGHLITATDASRIEALAYAVCEHYLAVQRAFDQGIIDAATYETHAAEFDDMVTRWPGLRSPLADIRSRSSRFRDAAVFRALDAADESAAP